MKNMNRTKVSVLVILLITVSSFTMTGRRHISIVFIGDSITQSVATPDPATQGPAVKATEYLKKVTGNDSIRFSNQGHSGATTFDFLPARGYFQQIEKASSQLEKDNTDVLIFSIMLGTNDSAVKGPHGAPASPEKYAENLRAIIDQLLGDFANSKVIIHHPIWYSPNTYNGAIYLQEGLNRLQEYTPEIKNLIEYYKKKNPNRVFEGDKDGFSFFKHNYQTCLHPEQGHQGTFYLHPNEKGASLLGEFWAKAIKQKILTTL